MDKQCLTDPYYNPENYFAISQTGQGGHMKTPGKDYGAQTDTAWQILDALDVHVAVLDKSGVILHTNRAWDDFTAHNPLEDGSDPLHIGVGANYLEICRTASGTSSENAYTVYLGIKDVLAGKKRSFSLEYPCHSPLEQRWFFMKASPLRGIRSKHVAVVHTNVTLLKRAEFEIQRKTLELSKALEHIENFARQLKSTLALETFIGSAKRHVNEPDAGETGNEGAEEVKRLKRLSRREQEVLLALARGERNADIARRLSLSAKSVSTYRSRVLEKLNARTTADLVTLMTRIEAM